MMRPGFSLVEILVALAISSFVMIMVFNTISLLKNSSKRYNELITNDSQQEMLFSQVQKDISALVIPLHGFIPNGKDKPEEQQKKQEQYNALYGLQIELENEQLKSLSFVTTSVLGAYGVFKPRMARVRYLLVPEQNSPGLFSLLRQESSELSLADFEKDATKNSNFSHVIAIGLKKCMIMCTVITQEEGKKKVEEVSSWSFAELMKKQKTEPKAPGTDKGPERIEQKIQLPHTISLKGMFADLASQREYPFDYAFFVPIDSRSTKQDQPTPATPAAPGETPTKPNAPSPASPATGSSLLKGVPHA